MFQKRKLKTAQEAGFPMKRQVFEKYGGINWQSTCSATFYFGNTDKLVFLLCNFVVYHKH